MGAAGSSASEETASSSQNMSGVLTDLSTLLRSHALDSRRLATLSWADFLSFIKALNEKCQQLTDENGKYLLFALKKGSSSSFLWKATVRVCCLKMNGERQVESRKILTLPQFLRLEQSLRSMVLPATTTTGGGGETSVKAPVVDVSASVFFDRIDAADEAGASDLQRECAVCLERRPDVLLPCTHCYCLPCIEQWKDCGHRWCPICREGLSASGDDSWVVSDLPPSDELTSYLLSLTEEH